MDDIQCAKRDMYKNKMTVNFFAKSLRNIFFNIIKVPEIKNIFLDFN